MGEFCYGSTDNHHKNEHMSNGRKDMQKITGLELMYEITWQEVMAVWRVGEAAQQQWKEHWQERGYASWQQWRTDYTKPLEPQSIDWHVYEIKDLTVLSGMYGAPTRGWINKCYKGGETRRLGDSIVQDFVKENEKVNAIKKNPPYQTMITGILHGKDIILVEGMHRALAIHDLGANEDYSGNITIALGIYSGDSVPVLGTGDTGI